MKYLVDEHSRLFTEPIKDEEGDFIAASTRVFADRPIKIWVNDPIRREVLLTREQAAAHIAQVQWLMDNHPAVRTGDPDGIEIKEWAAG